MLPEAQLEGSVARLLEDPVAGFQNHTYHLDDFVLRIALKAGVALFPDDGANAETLFMHAEAALKKAKASGDRYLFYTQKMTETVAGKLTLENHSCDEMQGFLFSKPVPGELFETTFLAAAPASNARAHRELVP
jgi:predicted signal transduction protein with EAL and GGDEF domain